MFEHNAQSSALQPGPQNAARARAEVKPGYSLPAYYYRSPERFAQDVEVMGEKAWLMAGHVAQIPKPGDYFLFDFGAESIIVIRAKGGEVNAFYNVCRHRGSRVCLEAKGSAKLLICPYHAWSYDTNGKLIGAQDMPADFNKAQFGLIQCHVGVTEGLIFLNFAHGAPPSFEAFAARMQPFLVPFDLGKAKIAARDVVSCEANWKLVAENFVECYHCAPSHKTYAKVHRIDQMQSDRPGDAANEESWSARMDRLGLTLPPVWDDPSEFNFQAAMRMEIGLGSLSGSIDGKPMAPKLGALQEWTQSWTATVFNPMSQISPYDDHAVMFSFIPRGPTTTDAVVTWLVREDAVEGKDYIGDRIADLWRITFAEDKTICADNQRGVNSSMYQPGPYSLIESRAAEVTDWYLRHFVDAAA